VLKKKVNERTQLLTIKNEQLSEYAFINAHKLRAPVARILGLVALYELKDSGLSTTAYTNMIKQEVQSLDLIVKSISDAVEEKRVFTRADILNPQ
jgi:light-regulated signal transduction histidine kinase (bacteriophytochrome)